MKYWSRLPLIAGLLGSAAHATTGPTPAEIDRYLATPFLTPGSAAEVDQRCAATVALIGQARQSLESRKGPATMAGDYAAYDALLSVLSGGGGEMSLVSETNPAEPIRTAAQNCVQKISDLGTAISLSRPIYDRLAAIPAAKLDPKSSYTLKKQLTDYRTAGVDKDAPTRAKVEALQKEITEIGLVFSKNIRDDKGDIVLDPGDLAGMPQDYVDTHKPGPEGQIHLTFAYPDIFPILDYASKREVRKKVQLAFSNRAWPANEAVLKSLLEKRYELARTLGLPDYATLVTADKMIGDPGRAARFLDEVNVAADPAAKADYAELLARARQLDPAIDRLERWDNSYFSNVVRKEKYDVDAAVVRQYFTFDKAKAGIFQLVRDLFGADIRPWNTPVWDKSVTAYELYDKGVLIGRFYLDMHPRTGKFSHAAQFGIRAGLAGRQVPIGALVCNFPATGPMDHDDVTTFLHEFGHLIHSLYSGEQRYGTQSMGNLQWDFIEAPSQLLEEWTWDYDTLKGFASDPQGIAIPKSLVDSMNRGRHFAEGIGWKGQLAYSAVSLNFYNRKPDFDLTQNYNAQIARYSMFPTVAGTHSYASFGHLDGYSAIYYTYVWSKAIALDLFTKFKAAGMRNPQVAREYRKLVLEPGGSQDANLLIENFLGRPMSTQALKDELKPR